MKKKILIVFLLSVGIFSISLNAIFIKKYYKTKNSYINSIYFNLVNLSTLIESFEFADSENSYLRHLEFIKEVSTLLDQSINGLNMIDNYDSQSIYKFRNINERILLTNILTEGMNAETKKTFTFYNELVKKLLKNLSVGRELNYSQHNRIEVNPNYALSIKEVLNLIESTMIDDSNNTK